MAAEDVEVIRKIYEHWSRGDWRHDGAVFADDVVATTFDADGDEIVLHGADALRAWFRGFLDQWDDFRQDADEIIDCGERVLGICHQSARGRASGAQLEMPVYNVWRLEDGKIVEFHTTRHEEVARRRAAGANP